jgi:L-2,4-diaminobutyric acid acetyltransferase
MTGSTASPKEISPVKPRLCRPMVSHGADIHRLVSECKPLDLNSVYAYLLLCEHFAQTCVLAERAGRVVGFVSAYRPPARSEAVFVWQVAVAEQVRGGGLAMAMLRDLLARDAVRDCHYLETTVTPSNAPSRRLFRSLARELDAPLVENVLFHEKDFGGEGHETEALLRIGPFTGL